MNGETVLIDPHDMRVVPIIKEGRTLLPLRFVVDNLKSSGEEDLLWDGLTQTVAILVKDPVCETEGFRYAKAVENKDGFYEFSVEYHSSKDVLPPLVKLVLGKMTIQERYILDRVRRFPIKQNSNLYLPRMG